MPKYRKNPVVIEAERTDVPVTIETLEGVMLAEPGDWIITVLPVSGILANHTSSSKPTSL